jgi:hypothetical protein
MGRIKKYLDQKLVDEFAKTRALEKKVDEWLEAVRDGFLEDLKAGTLCPTGGPYLIAIERGSKSDVDWKGELFQWISDIYCSAADGGGRDARREADKKAAAAIATIEKKAKRKKFERVVVKTNATFAHDISKQVIDHLAAVGDRERRRRPRK